MGIGRFDPFRVRAVSPQRDAGHTTAIALALQVLASEDEEMVGLRAQRGVGIDAPDEIRQFFALKVYEGDEPDEIELTDGELVRALESVHFFLVIVSGIEAGSAECVVRVIAHPLDQLHKCDDIGRRLGGVRSANYLVYRIAADDGT